jgi:hypothetical protein
VKKDDWDDVWINGSDDIFVARKAGSKNSKSSGKETNWFVQLPYPGILKALVAAGSAASAAVIVEIAHEAWFTKKRVVAVRSKPLREAGISRYAKMRAIDRLAGAGLIEIVDSRNGRNPIVRVKFKLRKTR